jgi:hypothetical protein
MCEGGQRAIRKEIHRLEQNPYGTEIPMCSHKEFRFHHHSAQTRSCYGVAMDLNPPSGVPRSEVNPDHIVPVTNFSADTLCSIIAHMEVSTDFEHLVYREAELDAIWSITGFFLVNEPNSSQLEAVRRLHAGAHKAHDLVADRRPAEAATVLRSFL